MMCFIIPIVIIGYLIVLLGKYNYLLSMLVSTVIFVMFLVSQPIVSKATPINRIMTFLGDISFSVYLIHSLIIRLLINAGVDTLGLFLLLTLASTIAISSFTYYFIEQPFIKLAKR